MVAGGGRAARTISGWRHFLRFRALVVLHISTAIHMGIGNAQLLSTPLKS
jgi:hypothetical protein